MMDSGRINVGWPLAICSLLYSTAISSSKIVIEVPGWGINVTRNTTDYISPYKDTTLISGREICELHGLLNRTFPEVVVVVFSAAINFATRTAIRDTWANHTSKYAKVGFIIGRTNNQTVQNALEMESADFKDIIQDDFVDSYSNLTLKSVSMLKWFLNQCPKSKFLVKADDDTYIDVIGLVDRLDTYHRQRIPVLAGNLYLKFFPHRKPKDKWYMPAYMYPYGRYPNFLQGSSYFMSRDVARKLFVEALKTPLLHLEDVYITGLCALKAELKPTKDDGIKYIDHDGKIKDCYSLQVLACNPVSVDKLWVVWSHRTRRKVSPDEQKFSNDFPATTLATTLANVSHHIMWTMTSSNLSSTTRKQPLRVRLAPLPKDEYDYDLPSACPRIFRAHEAFQYIGRFSVSLIVSLHHPCTPRFNIL